MDAVERILENTLRVPAGAIDGLYRALLDWKKPEKFRTLDELFVHEFHWSYYIDERTGDLYEIRPLSRAGEPTDWQIVLSLIAPYALEDGVLVYETVRGDLYRFRLTANEVGPLVEWRKGRMVWEEF